MRKNKVNVRPLRVAPKLNWFLVTLVGHEKAIRVQAYSKGHAYTKATAIFPSNRKPLAASVTVDRPKVRF